MQFKQEHIEYTTTGRFVSHGNPEKAKKLLIALHGYGQLVTFFIRKFSFLDPDEYYVVCPEGPHRFYHAGNKGRVGASWMTKEDRLNDIGDYIRFLDKLMLKLNQENQFEQKLLLGFSQGGATASRWVAFGKYNFDIFMLWAAVFPPDMDKTENVKFETQKNYFVVGNKDEYIAMNDAKTHLEILRNANMQFEFITFEGNHDINRDTLQTLIE